MEFISEIVEDWYDLAKQVQAKSDALSTGDCILVAAILLLAREVNQAGRDRDA